MKVLILYASAGAGHRTAAEALEKAFRTSGSSDAILTRDVLDFTPALFRSTYARGYLLLVRRVPELWGYLYAASDRGAQRPWRRKVRAAFNKINAASFLRYVSRVRPDLIVCTHFLPIELLSSRERRGRFPIPFAGVVTDFAVHSLWIYPNVPHYFVATPESRRHLVRSGCREERVRVTGIPVDPAFASSEAAETARARLGLDPRLPAVLLLSGGFGVGPTAELVAAFRRRAPPCQLVVVAGANEELRAEVEEAARGLPCPVRVHGYVKNMPELLDAAELVISKPGGMTTSEALAKGRPMLIVDPIPGQEQRNAEYVLECGAGLRLYDTADAPDQVGEILLQPGRLRALQQAARAAGRPYAAREIVATLRAAAHEC